MDEAIRNADSKNNVRLRATLKSGDISTESSNLTIATPEEQENPGVFHHKKMPVHRDKGNEL